MHVLEILFGFNGINKTSEQLPLWFGRQRAAGAASHGPARVTPRKDSGAWTGRRHVLKEIEFTGCQLTGTEGITAACWHSEGARGTGGGGRGGHSRRTGTASPRCASCGAPPGRASG